MSNIGLHFNGVNSYCEIPVNVKNANTWKATITLSTTDNTSGGGTSNASVYQQPCIFGYDSSGTKSRDFHVDIRQGKLYVFSGLSGTNDSSQFISGGTLTKNTYGDGWLSGIDIADGNEHIIEIEASYTTNKITIILDNQNLGYFNVTNTINSSVLYLGASYPYSKVFAQFDLYDFELEIDGVLTVSYQPSTSTIENYVLADSSGNSNNGTLYGIFTLTGYTGFLPKLFLLSTPNDLVVTPKIFVSTIPFQINLTSTFETKRNVVVTETVEADTSREISDGAQIVLISADTKRLVSNNYTTYFDTSRITKAYTIISASTLRTVVNPAKAQSAIGHNVLMLKPKTQIDNVDSFDTIQNFDFNGGIYTSGEYQIPSNHRIYNESGNLVYVDIDIDADAYNINQWIDFAIDFDTISNFDGANIGTLVNVTPYLRTSNDGTVYEDWRKAVSGAQYQAKYFDFKLKLETTDSNVNVIVSKFKYTVYT
jgi:hypothetical protein